MCCASDAKISAGVIGMRILKVICITELMMRITVIRCGGWYTCAQICVTVELSVLKCF